MKGITQHPEFAQLLEQAEALRSEVAQLLIEAHDLVHVVKPNLLALFYSKLGPWELKQLSAQCSVARLKRMIALAQTAINREQPIDWMAIDRQLDDEFATWKARIAEAKYKLTAAEARLKGPLSSEDSALLKKLYHALVKALHPDLHPEQSEHETHLWMQVQHAYDEADVATLQALHASLQQSAPSPLLPNATDELKAQIVALRAHREHLLKEIEGMKAEPPFTLEAQLLSETWLETRRAEIDTECAALANLDAQLQTHLQVLAAHPSNGTVTGLN